MSYELGDPTFDARTGIAGTAAPSRGRGRAVAQKARLARARGGLGDIPGFSLIDDGSAGWAPEGRPGNVRRAPARGWAFIDNQSLGDPTFDPRTGIAGLGDPTFDPRTGIAGYDGLGFSLKIPRNRFKVNAKSFTRPLKTAVRYAPLALPFVPLPGGSLFSRGRALLNRGKTIQTQVADAGLTLAKQQAPDGSVQVVATNGAGAVVTRALPVDPAVVDQSVPTLPSNAVQAGAPIQDAKVLPFIQRVINAATSQPAFSPAPPSSSPDISPVTSSGGSGGGGGAPSSDNGGGGVPPSQGVSPLLLAGGALVVVLLLSQR
jgi:hypothetical protein